MSKERTKLNDSNGSECEITDVLIPISEYKRLIGAIESAWMIMDDMVYDRADVWQNEFQDIIFSNSKDTVTS